ncbi:MULTISPECIES: hypothetical protein [Bacillus]|uniref:Uncharacterized protein n=1 Tax=Bacillus capparidis TaxID=1840411 RepID=A0ABS4CVA6_9BACI|nr:MULTISPECIES: hypothetical protein [Bacillus]MBP1081527.1 hypothetical protein [Bacillus capparidis]MED1096193.1 hypothetical protein [Bacillus capparidis]
MSKRVGFVCGSGCDRDCDRGLFFIIKNASAANDGYIAYMAGKIEFALAVVSIHM